MKAVEIAKHQVELLTWLEGQNISGYEKIALLRASAATLEAILASEALEQSMRAAIANIFNPPKK